MVTFDFGNIVWKNLHDYLVKNSILLRNFTETGTTRSSPADKQPLRVLMLINYY